MGLLNSGGSVLFIGTLLCLLVRFADANVVLIGRNVSLSFEDVEATFAPAIKGSGECGVLYLAEPQDACTLLTNKVEEGPNPPFVLIIRGGCTFDDKVRHAQNAGFKAAIVYDNEDSGTLISMAGTPGGIHINAVFVSKASGGILKKYAGHTDVEFWIIPNFESSAWSIMAISFISLLAMSAVLATCFFVRRHRIRREQPTIPNVREFHGMSSRLVKAMPSLIFTSVLEDNCTSSTCAICLEDYRVGEKLRILPCRHKFHAVCVDSWLTTWRSFCPVCKQDAQAGIANLPASECTPLLSSGAATPSTAALSSFHSSVASSPSSNIQIVSTPSRSESTSQTPFLSIPPRIPYPRSTYNHSPAISISRSSADLRNASSHRSRSSHIVSPHSMGFPSSSPIHSRFTSIYIPSSSNASPSYLAGSSSRQSYLRHCSESGASLSALASAQSLPGC
uniref:Receptor homology region, transmembrane domain- and RING domain-containing protein 1 isoform X1 n=1 Tax=Elaeis guineensis var. tenera TaxID=51953 RepID=A0A6I9QJR9_ELAGV|nr:receptor homology region, transmembrane domain- and RING domain-containing protein 1 isoform X1 [Elaeis guineensis]XP_010910672.1 receptor homology region, transmembrane domain- and RING domain-containing protein 1 isoform X1 [Elaeis guineensis]